MAKSLVIAGQKIAAGQHDIVKFDVARLPSDTRVQLNVFVYRSKKPGPTLLAMAGLHGDEINGVEIIRQSIKNGVFERLQQGNVIAIPLLNIFGFINFSRDVPDGKDVNRSFPGRKNGSLAARVAYALTQHILPLVDLGIDFHTGGGSRHNFPQIRFSPSDSRARELANVFAAPFHLESRPIAGSLRKEALKAKKPILVFEGGESLRFDKHAIEAGLAGMQRVMHSLGMIPEAPPPEEKSILLTKNAWIRAKRSGLFVWVRGSGEFVSKGELLGLINDPYGKRSVKIKASQTGYIIGHNNAPVVNQGDALFHMGYAP